MNHCCRNFICNNNNNNSICSHCNPVLASNISQNSQENDVCSHSEQTLYQTLCECIGLKCNCEFAIEGDLISKTGILERVGSNYLILRSANNNNALLCDLCNLKFVTVTC